MSSARTLHPAVIMSGLAPPSDQNYGKTKKRSEFRCPLHLDHPPVPQISPPFRFNKLSYLLNFPLTWTSERISDLSEQKKNSGRFAIPCDFNSHSDYGRFAFSTAAAFLNFTPHRISRGLFDLTLTSSVGTNAVPSNGVPFRSNRQATSWAATNESVNRERLGNPPSNSPREKSGLNAECVDFNAHSRICTTSGTLSDILSTWTKS